MSRDPARIEGLETSIYRIPTDHPESDGTFEWNSTTLVLVRAMAADKTGLGYTYADTATARLIEDVLAKVVADLDATATPKCWQEMVRAIRNLGRPGIASMAISAVDCALWDLKARLLGMPLVGLLGAARQSVPIYGSGGFTSYSLKQLEEQLANWVALGIARVKMKLGGIQKPIREGCRSRERRSVLIQNSSSMPTEVTAENRRCIKLTSSLTRK